MNRRAFFVVVGASVLLGACGNGGVSKSAYVQKGNVICETAQNDFNALFETSFPVTQAEIPGFFQKATPIVQKQQTDLRKLEPPEADKATVEVFLVAGDKAVADFQRASTDAQFGATLFAAEGGENAKEAEEKAVAYGLDKCKDEDEDQSGAKKADPSTFSTEKRAFVEKADAICQGVNDQIKPLEEQYLTTFPPPLDGYGQFFTGITPIIRTGLAELRALTPPAADTAMVDNLLSQQEAQVAKLEQAGALATAGNEEAFVPVARETFTSGDEADAAARAYGFQVCGSEE